MKRQFYDIIAGIGMWLGKPGDNGMVERAAVNVENFGEERMARRPLGCLRQQRSGDNAAVRAGYADNTYASTSGRR